MGKAELDNLVRINKLHAEEPRRGEFDGMVSSATKRLADAGNRHLSSESRFDLAYNADHGFALAALRCHGYRPVDRVTVFQSLAHTVPTLDRGEIAVFVRCHRDRNLAEYEGHADIDPKLLEELVNLAGKLRETVLALAPPAQ